MINKMLGRFIRGVSENIGLIYFFILPVYFPIRALGVELNAYAQVLHESSRLILFFSQITILIAFTSIFLSFFMDFLNKNYFKNREHLFIHWYRFIASILSIIFVISSYFVLNPADKLQLYFWSGAHYFIISFFQLLIRAELNTYTKNQRISVTQANNYFGFSLNLVGIISIFIFGWFYENNELTVYSKYCVYLEVIFVIYLLIIRGYWRDCLKIVLKFGRLGAFSYIILITIALIFSGCLSLFVMSIGVLAPMLTIVFIGIIYNNFKKSLHTNDLKLIINISLGYGLILAVFTGSVLTYFLHNLHSSIDLFNFAYSSEPFVSLILGAIMAWSLVKSRTEYSRIKLYQQISYINYLVPLVFLIFYYSLISEQHVSILLITMFGVFAYIEYMSMFFMRQVAQLSGYNNFQGTRLASFNVIVLNGLCPSLIYLSVYICSQLTNLSLDAMLINTMMGLIVISLAYNSIFKYRVT
ncbi:TPA: hypothetical protein JBC15_12760 [Legionella pneumophila subsp. pneumophila]|uniref:Polysaccharide biosynthesis protein n=1 Tax=Legionella bononiensis TaxID=2793102 RepID=A0ABS1W7E7_9GAMM|nr:MULTISPECIES: hypothetical protein [Legionella]HAT9067745.1 hypothetical protein [Legionella pneumophila subsp. pneumophila]HAU1859718.1 hypothetical protein [Legionella pneumophila]MBL7478513.1 hypothetical protein [Legionella bononiensis]MBL7525280.1 hypothetical protein [Legionella bononiensis]MBL7561470.1 hypothetical protein [Legionella bononiensis]